MFPYLIASASAEDVVIFSLIHICQWVVFLNGQQASPLNHKVGSPLPPLFPLVNFPERLREPQKTRRANHEVFENNLATLDHSPSRR